MIILISFLEKKQDLTFRNLKEKGYSQIISMHRKEELLIANKDSRSYYCLVGSYFATFK